MLDKATVVIMLQYINVSNQYMCTLNLQSAICQLYLNEKKLYLETNHYI